MIGGKEREHRKEKERRGGACTRFSFRNEYCLLVFLGLERHGKGRREKAGRRKGKDRVKESACNRRTPDPLHFPRPFIASHRWAERSERKRKRKKK